MLLEKLGTIRCTTRNKMLPGEGALPKFETTAEGTGTLGGSNVKSLATYQGGIRADGFLEG